MTVLDYKSPPKSTSSEPKSLEFFTISSISLMFQKAKNVENGLIHFTYNYKPVGCIEVSLIFTRCPMNHFLPNPKKAPKMTFGVLGISGEKYLNQAFFRSRQ